MAIHKNLLHHPRMAPVHGLDEAADLGRDALPLRQALIRYYTRRVGEVSDIEDLVQEVFARLVRRDSAAPIEHLGKYVYQTAASVLTDYARRRSARRSHAHIPFNPEVHGGVEFDPERILLGKKKVRAAAAALLSLPERTRTIFALRRLDGVPPRQIAEQLGISVSAVEKHMLRAVTHLGRAMGKTDDA